MIRSICFNSRAGKGNAEERPERRARLDRGMMQACVIPLMLIRVDPLAFTHRVRATDSDGV